MFRSIRWRIAFSFGVLILAAMLAFGFYLSGYTRSLYMDNLNESMTSQVRLLGVALASDWESIDIAQYDKLARDWADASGNRVTIIAQDGVVLGESAEDRSEMDNHLNRPEVQQALADGVGSSIRFSTTKAVRMLYVAVPVHLNGKTVAVVRMAYPLTEVEESVARLQRDIWLFSFLAAFLAVLLSFWIAHLISRPVARMTQLANQIAEGKPGEYVQVRTADEVGQLSQALGRMSNRLQEHIEDLKNEQVKLSVILAQMTDGVVIVDPQGNISLLNPSAEQIFVISQQKARGQSLMRALGYHQIFETWDASQKEGKEKTTTLELTYQQRFIQVIATPLGGELQDHTLLLCQDLTPIRRLETVRRDFISNISHELRTPLASLKALAETLQLSAIDDPQTSRHFLERMDTEIDALTQMVNELLELARIESGRVPIDLKPTDSYRLLVAASERLKMQAERAGLLLEVEAQPDLPKILADGPRLEQVLVNIIHNAIKFTSPGGKITVFAYPESGMVCFGVQDTGTGIPRDMLPRVFERFYKADQARSGGGTGLGLSIARHLVEMHAGRIWAESQPGRGSTFYFTIPQARH